MAKSGKRPKSRTKISAVDLFCGAAGLSLGLQKSGITISAGVDMDPACKFPFETNIAARFIESDISALEADTVAKLFDSDIRVLAGCAPCQPFSG